MFLASLLAVTPGSLVAALVLQALLCSFSAVLAGDVAQGFRPARGTGAVAGVAAGLALALYGPAVYVDTVVLSEGLLLLLLCLALWALARDRITWQTAALAGAAMGAATLVRPTAIVIAVAVLGWLVVRWVRPSVSSVSLVSFVSCAAIIVLPVIAKNYALSGTPSIQGYGGLNVYIGNSPLHDGRATFRIGKGWDALNSEAMRAGVTDPSAQDRYYLRKTFAEIAAHPLAYLALMGRKALWMVQSQESRDSHSYYFFTDRSALLRVLPRFGLLFPLACVGALAIARTRRERSGESPPIVSLLAIYSLGAAATVVFLVVGLRYRMPLVPVLAIAAGVGVDALVRMAQRRQVRGLIVCGVVALGATAIGHVLNDPRNTNLAEEWAFTGSSLVTEHNLPEAEAAYRRAISLDPGSGLAWDGLGLALYDAGRLGEARQALERALALDPASSRAVFHLALVDEREGRMAEAADGYQRALSLSPYDSEVKGHLAAARRQHARDLGMAQRTREARDEMRRALEADPADGEAWLDLCLLALDLGDRNEAAAALQRAKNLGAEPQRVAFAETALRMAR
jgi:tetratricopeptide (TPR) repeat protein